MCSENKDADQLRVYREADLRLCFRICEKPVFTYQGYIKVAFCCLLGCMSPCHMISHVHTSKNYLYLVYIQCI